MSDEPDNIDELMAAAQQTAEQAQAALGLAAMLWRFYEALTTAGFPPEAALHLTGEYFRALWAQANTQRPQPPS